MGPAVPRPKFYRAPTWTWASLGGVMGLIREEETYHEVHEFHVKVNDINIQYVDAKNPFGEIGSARLTLSCDYIYQGIIHRDRDHCQLLPLASKAILSVELLTQYRIRAISKLKQQGQVAFSTRRNNHLQGL